MPAVTLDDPLPYAARRLLFVGVTGSGKTTLARRVGQARGIPAFDVDALAWGPGWVKTPDDDLRDAAEKIAATDAWILDSAWSAIRPVVLPRTELVVGLDFPSALTFARLAARTWHRARTQESICGENTESWRSAVSRDSILLWHLRTVRRKHRQITDLGRATHGPPVLRLRTPTDAERWIEGLQTRPQDEVPSQGQPPQ